MAAALVGLTCDASMQPGDKTRALFGVDWRVCCAINPRHPSTPVVRPQHTAETDTPISGGRIRVITRDPDSLLAARAPQRLEEVPLDKLGGAAARAELQEWAVLLAPQAQPAPLRNLLLLLLRSSSNLYTGWSGESFNF